MAAPTTRRSVLALAAGSASLVLTACSGENASKDNTHPAGSSGGDGRRTRTVTDASGKKVKVPERAKRVVTLHYAATQPLTDLGLYPVGQGEFMKGFVPASIEPRLAEVPFVTTGQEVSVEKVAKAKPDLIMAPNVLKDDLLGQLREIAPVFVFTLRGEKRGNWKNRNIELGRALGRTTARRKLDAAFRQRQKAIAKDYADVIKGKTVGFVAVWEDNNVALFGQGGMMGNVLAPLGFTWSAQENAATKSSPSAEATVSFEKIGSVGDVDVLFLDSNMRGKVSPLMKSLQATSLYKNMRAVKAGEVYPVGKGTVAGYGDANYSLDQVEKALKKMRG